MYSTTNCEPHRREKTANVPGDFISSPALPLSGKIFDQSSAADFDNKVKVTCQSHRCMFFFPSPPQRPRQILKSVSNTVVCQQPILDVLF